MEKKKSKSLLNDIFSIIGIICNYAKERELATKLLYHSRQITCGMFVICYITFLKYTPKLLSKIIHVKTYVNNPELDIYLNFHALLLIIIFISIYIASKPIERKSDYE